MNETKTTMDYIIQELNETIVDQAIEIKNLKQELNELRNELHHLYGMVEEELEEELPSWVWESPDGGKTLYRRKMGSPVSSREEISKEELPSYFTDSTNTLNIP